MPQVAQREHLVRLHAHGNASGPVVISGPNGDADTPVADHRVKVALAAYFIAQKRGFEPGHELDDWLAAEVQIAAAEQPNLPKPIQAAQMESIS